MNIFKEFVDVFRILQENNIEFIVIGGIAGIYYGLPRPTYDFDIVIKYNMVSKTIKILYKNGFKVVNKIFIPEGKIVFFNDAMDAIKGIEIEKPRAFKVVKKNVTGDIWFEPRLPYIRMLKNCNKYKLTNGVILNIVSLDDLIKLKSLSGKEEDLKDIIILKEIKNIGEK